MPFNSRARFGPSQQARPRFSRPTQILLIGIFRDAMAEMARGVKPLLRRRWVFDNAGYRDRGCASDSLATAYDDVLDALKAAPITNEQRLEQALALPRTMELVARARFGSTLVLDITDVILAEGRADAVADPNEQEVLADPMCPTKRRRLLTVWTNHRNKLDAGIQWLVRHMGVADRGVA